MHVFLALVTSLRMIFSSSIYLSAKFMMSSFLNVILSEITQTQKDIHGMYSLISVY